MVLTCIYMYPLKALVTFSSPNEEEERKVYINTQSDQDKNCEGLKRKVWAGMWHCMCNYTNCIEYVLKVLQYGGS